jgi:hypothetical protein
MIGAKAMVGVINRDTHLVLMGDHGEEPDLIINSREFSDKDSLEIVLAMMNIHANIENTPIKLSDYADQDPNQLARQCAKTTLWHRTARGEVDELAQGYVGQLMVARSGAASENSGYRFLDDYQINMLSSLSLAGALESDLPKYGLKPEESPLWAIATQPNINDPWFNQLAKEREIVKAICVSAVAPENQEEDYQYE